MFEEAKLKIGRGAKHARDFESAVSSFVQSDFYGFVLEGEALNFKFINRPPSELGLILGDAIHCFRAALDLGFVELVRRAGYTPTKWTTFRIWEDRQKLITTLEKTLFQGAPDIVQMLSNTLMAYEGGNDLLCALNALDIDDKHRVLLPVVSVTLVTGVSAKINMGGAIINMTDCAFHIDSQGAVNVAGMPASIRDIEIRSLGSPSMRCLFGTDTATAGQEVIPKLAAFELEANKVLTAFEALLAQRDQH